MERMPVQDVLSGVTKLKSGQYQYSFTRSLCVGLVTHGGLLASAGHKVAQLFIADDAKLSTREDLLQSSVHFFRPVFSSPKTCELNIGLVNASKVWTTLHVDLLQGGKLCMSGYYTFTNLSIPGQISVSTGWTLNPPPPKPPLAIGSPELEDQDPNWIGYLTPVAPDSIRNAQSYIKWHIPFQRATAGHLDHCVTPGWENRVWTNELLHFVLDNHMPYWQNYVDASVVAYCRYESVVAAGLEQRKARKEGRDDKIFGENCGPKGPLNWVSSSVSLSTEFKKPLPAAGTKWLFMRVESSELKNDRLDERIFLMDVHGDLIAIAHQLVHVIPMASKMADKKANL